MTTTVRPGNIARADDRPAGLAKAGGASRPPLVLVVDDDPRVGEILRITLRDEGFEVRTAASPPEIERLVDDLRPDAVVLDPAMQEMEGLAVLQRLRSRSQVPLLVLSKGPDVPQMVEALKAGADDYLQKPFSVDELAARVRAVIRRATPTGQRAMTRIGDLELDLERRLVLKAGRPVVLSRMEWQLLLRLAQTPGRVVVYEDLLDALWGEAYRDDVQLLRVCVSRLREKLGSRGRRNFPIRTYVGIGYALVGEAGITGVGQPSGRPPSG
jgi:two-component system, OmpR family, KDP operon response regulator KdpE